MPSFVKTGFSESVELTASENSPYEPPHLTLLPPHEKTSSPDTNTTEVTPVSLANSLIREEQPTPKPGLIPSSGVANGLDAPTQDNLTSLPNGRSREGSPTRDQGSPGGTTSHHDELGSDDGWQRSSTINGVVRGEGTRASPIDKVMLPLDGNSTDGKLLDDRTGSDEQPPVTRNPHGRSGSTSNATHFPLLPITIPEPSKPDVPHSSASRVSPPLNNDIASLSPPSASSPHRPVSPRLQHRHTLQVPRSSTQRTSREFSWSNNVSEDAFSGAGSPPTGRRGSLNLARRNTRSVHSDLYFDDIQQDGDAVRWTETVRQKRMSRRKRKEEEEDDRVMVGTKVDQNHVNWVTAYNMLTGIRFTVSRTNAKIDRDLTDQDFDAQHKFSFDITGNELTPSAKYDFKFKDYAPLVFRHLRAQFHLDPADYLISLTSKYILSELGSPGKSGSFFYFSRDYKYIIKTIHHAEHKLLRRILRDYYAHVGNNPNTLMSQFYGLHRVKIPYGRKIHFVVMNNLFPPHRDIHQTFDLKGSTIGRDFKEEDLEQNPRATLKDLNWLRRNHHLEFGPTKKGIFIEQMQRDVALLQRLDIMDYSLLVGIHDLGKGNDEKLRDKILQVFQPSGEREEETQASLLTRTPSKMETARKARELRQIIKREKPVPMDQSTFQMPEEETDGRKNFIFYADDGGFRATHEDGTAGEEIYYLGIIDCLTHVNLSSQGVVLELT